MFRNNVNGLTFHHTVQQPVCETTATKYKRFLKQKKKTTKN